jgi:translation initiation factor 5A
MAEEGHVEVKEGCRPMQASLFRKGTHIILKDKPCKVVEMSTSKTGKHGHAKVNFTGIDIFTARKYKEIQGSTHPMLTFDANKLDWGVMSMDGDTVNCIDDKGSLLDIDLPPDEELAKKIKDAVEADQKEVIVTVMTALGESQITGFALKDRTDD